MAKAALRGLLAEYYAIRPRELGASRAYLQFATPISIGGACDDVGFRPFSSSKATTSNEDLKERDKLKRIGRVIGRFEGEK